MLIILANVFFAGLNCGFLIGNLSDGHAERALINASGFLANSAVAFLVLKTSAPSASPREKLP